MDVNDDEVTEDGTKESIFPRGDFNGDGKLSIEAQDSAFVPGAVGERASDLDVLKYLFDDPDYLASDLDTLVFSQDLHINLQSLWTNTAAQSVEIEVRDAQTRALAQSRMVPRSDGDDPVLTLSSVEDGYRRYRIEVSTATIDFTFGDHVFYFGSGGWDHYLRPVAFEKVPVRGAFLTVCEEDEATSPAIVDLTSIGLEPGDHIFAYSVGDAALAGPGPEGDASVYAVFSGSGTLRGDDEQQRVPDAIATNLSNFTDAIQCNDTTTIQPDIPQDFRIPPEGVVLDVPAEATHLFLARQSSWYKDNFDTDGDYGLQIVIMRSDYGQDNGGLGQHPSAAPGHDGNRSPGRSPPIEER
jgi:hypothetical protein